MSEFITYMQRRKEIYELLSFAYYMEPNKKYLADLKKYLPTFQQISLSSDNTDMKKGYEYLNTFFANNIDDATINYLECEFAKIFLLMSSQAGVPGVSPHESVYLSDNHSIMQEQRDEVLKIYYDEGMGINNDVFKESEDHLSAELYFISKMSANTVAAINSENVDETKRLIILQNNFLNDHILKWLDLVTDDVFKLTRYDFYKAISMITKGFIKIDVNELKGIIEDIR